MIQKTCQASDLLLCSKPHWGIEDTKQCILECKPDLDGKYKISGLEDLCNFSLINPKDVIIQIFEKWQNLSESEKINMIQHNLCFELLVFIKLNDSDFFLKHCVSMIQQIHVQDNLIVAWLLNDEQFLENQLNYFENLNSF